MKKIVLTTHTQDAIGEPNPAGSRRGLRQIEDEQSALPSINCADAFHRHSAFLKSRSRCHMLAMTLTGFIAYAGALAIAAAIPGPGVTALVARALGSGFRSSLFMALGLVLGDLTYLTAVVLGLAFLAQTFGIVFLVIKWLGVAYLAWLAYSFWRTGISAERIEARKASGSFAASFLAGLLVTLGNPKTMIFYIALTPTIVDLRTISFTDYAALATITVAVLLVVLVPYLALAARARSLLAAPRALKALNRTAAGFMMGAAATIALRQ
jgi:threonine/homoserine/homoserine lactone efflux protein